LISFSFATKILFKLNFFFFIQIVLKFNNSITPPHCRNPQISLKGFPFNTFLVIIIPFRLRGGKGVTGNGCRWSNLFFPKIKIYLDVQQRT
jgi:hypothetical protein